MKPAKPFILVVEDAPDQVHLFTAYLQVQNQDCDILNCSTVQKALEILSKAKPKMIVLDLKLEDGSGEEVLVYAKEHHPETKVLVVTGDRSEATLKKYFDMGADDYVSKPVDELIFRSKARSILSSRYVSPINFLGRREGLGTLTVHADIQIKRLDEFSGVFISTFQILNGGLLSLSISGVSFDFKVTQSISVPSQNIFLLEGQVVRDSIEDSVGFRRALLNSKESNFKKDVAS